VVDVSWLSGSVAVRIEQLKRYAADGVLVGVIEDAVCYPGRGHVTRMWASGICPRRRSTRRAVSVVLPRRVRVVGQIERYARVGCRRRERGSIRPYILPSSEDRRNRRPRNGRHDRVLESPPSTIELVSTPSMVNILRFVGIDGKAKNISGFKTGEVNVIKVRRRRPWRCPQVKPLWLTISSGCD